MLTSAKRSLSAALCLACVAGLTACGTESDVAATAKAAGSTSEAATPAVGEVTEPTQVADAAAEQSEPAEPSERAPTRDARSVDRADLTRAAAREAREGLTARTTVSRDPESVRDADARRDALADTRATVHRQPVIVAEPAVLDLGTMPAGEQGTGTVRLTNTSDTVVTLLTSRTSCGCTVANVPRNHAIAPGEFVEVDVQLRTNASRAERLTKTATFVFEDHPNVVVQVTGESITYITLTPHIIDPESNPDGRVVLRSSDGEPFRIISVTPLLAADLPEEPATEHEIFLSWDQWNELRQPRRFEISVDHPLMQSVAGVIRAPRVAPTARDGQPAEHLTRDQRPVREVPLHTLALQGSVDRLMQRLSDGGDIEATDGQGNSLLSIAAREGHVDLMRALLEAEAKVNSFSITTGITPLMNATQSRNTEAVLLLLEAGADIHARDTRMGGTALSWAAMGGNAEMVKALLDAGAEIEVVSHATGWTPLTGAVFSEDNESLKLLIDAGAKIEPRCTIQGATPIMYAAGTGRAEKVKMLLEAGANLETKDAAGHTVLIFAARAAGATLETIRTLLDAGADVHAKDARGLNALDHARVRDTRRDEIVALLEPYFASDDADE